MPTYKDALVKLLNDLKGRGLIDYTFYNFSSKKFESNAQSRICHLSINSQNDYNKDSMLMVFTIGKNVGRIVIQSEGGNTTNPSSTYPQKIEALHLAKKNEWKYIGLAISSEDFENETIRDYVVSIESTDYATVTAFPIDDCINALASCGKPDFYRYKKEASNNVEYTLSFIKKEKFLDYVELYDNRFEVKEAHDDKEMIFEGFGPWLVSFNNPDYTGTEKYDGYVRSLCKLIAFMKEKKLIEDDNLNDLNVEKYKNIIEVYKGSNEAREFDHGVKRGAGSAALQKYVNYIEYLLAPHTNAFNYLTTKNESINKIFFGVPGCGKSYHIDHEILGKDRVSKEYVGTYAKENIIRTTFYQDYSNTDFVGQILPKISKDENGKDLVEYIFNPGPFTLALIQAISNPTKKVALVVEEINRGNAPAIFGDIFQLLDRDENSVSEYGIVNVSIIDYLNDYEFTVNGKKVKYHFDEIKIPGNLDILATMNTSDQNVYTLDTAFTRRWEKERISNGFKKHPIEKMFVPGMVGYTWGAFVDGINERIKESLEVLQINEDKQVGAFFIKASDLIEEGQDVSEEKKKAFAYKVLEYLWEDVSKLDHARIFNSYNTFEDLVEKFIEDGVAVFNNDTKRKIDEKIANIN